MFRDNDVICFLGDSITAGGLWMGEVYQVLRKKYKLRCFNSGVSGGAASRAERYLHANCLIYNPDYVVINFGVNDSGSWLLSKTHEHVSDKKEQLDKGIVVKGNADAITVDLHIIVTYGMNINAIAQSIVHKVKYVVYDATGIDVKKVTVKVDGIKE